MDSDSNKAYSHSGFESLMYTCPLIYMYMLEYLYNQTNTYTHNHILILAFVRCAKFSVSFCPVDFPPYPCLLEVTLARLYYIHGGYFLHGGQTHVTFVTSRVQETHRRSGNHYLR